MENKDNRNKILFGSILLVVLAAVIYLALQTPEQTMTLSETVRAWISKLGYSRGPSEIRSDVHLPEYFVVGITTILFFKAMRWKSWAGAIVASAFALFEETMKIFLPTREFGAVDLLKDIVGVWLAFVVVKGFERWKGRKKLPEGSEGHV